MIKRKNRNFKMHTFVVLLSISLMHLHCAHTSTTFYKSISNFDSNQITSISLIECSNVVSKKNIFGHSYLNINEKLINSLLNQFEIFNIELTDETHKIPKDELYIEKIHSGIDSCINEILEKNYKDGQLYITTSINQEVKNLSNYVSNRYMLFCRVLARTQSTGNKIINLDFDGDFFMMYTGIIDSYSGNVIWFCIKISLLNSTKEENIDAMVRSTLLELKIKRNFDPDKLLFNKERSVTIYMLDKKKIYGDLISFEGEYFVVKDFNGNTRTVAFKDVSSLRYGN